MTSCAGERGLFRRQAKFIDKARHGLSAHQGSSESNCAEGSSFGDPGMSLERCKASTWCFNRKNAMLQTLLEAGAEMVADEHDKVPFEGNANDVDRATVSAPWGGPRSSSRR
jgi:hypothetical protein